MGRPQNTTNLVKNTERSENEGIVKMTTFIITIISICSLLKIAGALRLI